MIDIRLEHDIGVAEADKLIAYRDSLGYWTIGRGHLLSPQEHDWTGYQITPEEDQRLFDGDIVTASAFANRLPEWADCDTDARQNSLIELCYNLRGRWLGFHKAREAWLRMDWQIVHDELLDSLWAKQVHSVRATRIATYVLTGHYPQ